MQIEFSTRSFYGSVARETEDQARSALRDGSMLLRPALRTIINPVRQIVLVDSTSCDGTPHDRERWQCSYSRLAV